MIGDQRIDLRPIGRIAIVGAGKAGAGMAVALENVLGPKLLTEKQVQGWVNVPDDCLESTQTIKLHPARPAGVNEPTAAGVDGTQRILQLVASLGPADLCIVLISGGGSALLPAPIDGLALETKAELTRELSARGATIGQLNSVRRELSQVKAGGLARACRAGKMVALILSDVLGDDLATVASGPTVQRSPMPQGALQVLQDLGLADHPAGRSVVELLRSRSEQGLSEPPVAAADVTNLILGNNALAVDAAGIEAERLGYRHAMIAAQKEEGTVDQVAQRLIGTIESMRSGTAPDCLISGGEPTVELVSPEQRGLGGRNQQLALAVLAGIDDWRQLAMLSAGTDGEDGPTDAAGAVVDGQVVETARQQGLDPADYLRRNDAYHFFEQAGGLLKTGPTNTNVCDLRVVTVEQ